MKNTRKLVAIAFAMGSMALASCNGGNTYKIACVTDVGLLMDQGFNQGTYEGCQSYGEANNITYNYYQPANGSSATTNDRIAALREAIANGAEVIVTPGYMQADALSEVVPANPNVKFIFIDGWAMGYDNLVGITYKEHESAFLAGYAAVKDGYTKLGGTFGGGGTGTACNRFCYGYIQGANYAAKELGIKNVDVKISFSYGDTYSASPELQTQIASWYAAGTEIVFACGGSMFQSVKAAAEATTNGKIIGVDVDQSSLSERVITSATKGLKNTVYDTLAKFYAGKWDSELANKASQLGAADNGAVCLPDKFDRFNTFTKADYTSIFNKIVDGTVAVKGGFEIEGTDVINAANGSTMKSLDNWNSVCAEFENVTVSYVE